MDPLRVLPELHLDPGAKQRLPERERVVAQHLAPPDLDQRRREVGFERLPLLSDESGRLVRLGDIATIERRARSRQTAVSIDGRPAIEMRLKRNENASSLASAAARPRFVATSPPSSVSTTAW